MEGWPDSETAVAFIGNIPEDDATVVGNCLDAVVEYLTERVCLDTTTNTNGDEIPVVPGPVAQAALLMTSRLYRLRNLPNEYAVEGMTPQPSLLQGVETMISPWRKWGVA